MLHEFHSSIHFCLPENIVIFYIHKLNITFHEFETFWFYLNVFVLPA